MALKLRQWVGMAYRLINTILLLTSSITAHFAHVALEQEKRGLLKFWLGLTVVLGVCVFVLPRLRICPWLC